MFSADVSHYPAGWDGGCGARNWGWRARSHSRYKLIWLPYWIMTVKTVLNNLWTHVGYEDDGRLVHTDKRTGAQKISLKAWFDVASARRALFKLSLW
jgi:hypothetical protein